MNEILEFLNSHASVRKFTKKEISEEDELKIITAAQRSATSSNVQAYSIIGVRDTNTKQKLAELTGNQNHVAESSLFLVFCADLYRLYQINKAKGYAFNGDTTEMFIIATVDASLASCRALMAAQSLGAGGVMVGGIRNRPDEICDLLNLPEFVYPVMGMSLGYPETEPKVKPRLPLEAVYHREKYDDSNYESLIKDYDETISKLGYLNGREVQSEKYPDFNGTYSWSEHTARRMANDSASATRAHMKQFLQNRGFIKK